ncbi:hypothetical protein CASFOL_023566 [Castilleja foliolosa]|uniref:Phosphoinositide phospholipase C n=1 Tax=Castilleja foliolosa TaxID=1961234 RepID=A0ABD3CLX8_9LAMI
MISMAPSILGVHHDMTAPLQHYFIYTGHNSYLTGNQLSSDCSEIPIARALENGVRGIELDLWPNSTKDNVHVLHGRYGASRFMMRIAFVFRFFCCSPDDEVAQAGDERWLGSVMEGSPEKIRCLGGMGCRSGSCS